MQSSKVGLLVIPINFRLRGKEQTGKHKLPTYENHRKGLKTLTSNVNTPARCDFTGQANLIKWDSTISQSISSWPEQG